MLIQTCVACGREGNVINDFGYKRVKGQTVRHEKCNECRAEKKPALVKAKTALRLVAFCRVSTDGQRDNTSLETQERDIRDYCRMHGHELVEIISVAETAYDASKRTNFNKVLEVLEQGAADGLIVLKLDRFSRTVAQGIEVLKQFKDKGWELICVKDQIDTSSALGKAFFQLALVFSELERDQFMERSRAGWEAKKATGAYASGQPPYGWRAERGQLVRDEQEQAVIRVVAQWNEAGHSLNSIARQLNAQGILTKNGKQWGPQQVKSVIAGPSKQKAAL